LWKSLIKECGTEKLKINIFLLIKNGLTIFFISGIVGIALMIPIAYVCFVAFDTLLLNQAGLGGNLIVDNLIMGITGLPWILSVFAALVGSLIYKPEESEKKPKKAKKSKEELKEMPEPTFEIKDRCEKCGSKLLPTDDFCADCGTKKKKRS